MDATGKGTAGTASGAHAQITKKQEKKEKQRRKAERKCSKSLEITAFTKIWLCKNLSHSGNKHSA